MVSNYFWLVPILPWIGALWIGIGYIQGHNRGEAGEAKTTKIALGMTGLSFLLVLWTDFIAIFSGSPGQVLTTTWLESGQYKIQLGFTLDRFGLAMTTLVALLSLLSIRFSINYLHREAGYQRFFLVMLLFIGGMLLIVSAGNVALTFFGWEIAGMSSYLLIAYAYKRPVATANATRVFMTNRVGDVGFILGIFFVFSFIGHLEWSAIALKTGLTNLQLGLICGSFFLAALAKSAMVPFSPWIGRALEGPTPSSAIFYGSLMVHSGVYLLIRLQPVIEQLPPFQTIIVFFGGLSVLYGYFGGLVQSDVKSTLIFSTTTHVGLMFVACGLGWFTLAAWYLAAHAIWRAYQFLNAPDLLHQIRPTRQVPPWLKRQEWLYSAAIHRFWLDQKIDWLLVKPTQAIAKDTEQFETHIVNPLIGLPNTSQAISSLGQWEAQKRIVETGMGQGQGLLGQAMEWIATLMQWFEEHLVLKSTHQGLLTTITHIGQFLIKVEVLIAKPRYLILMILVTFIMIG